MGALERIRGDPSEPSASKEPLWLDVTCPLTSGVFNLVSRPTIEHRRADKTTSQSVSKERRLTSRPLIGWARVLFTPSTLVGHRAGSD